VGADDGLLVRDINNNGIIDNGRELFGDSTLLKSGRVALNGFEALADLDSNKDGVISATDTGFDQLRVWQDANGDAVSQADELHDLYSLGIKEIRLAAEAVNVSDGKGNIIVSSSTILREDGTESAIADYNLQRNQTYTKSTTATAVAAEITALPDLDGFGTVANLQQAMRNNAALQALVEQFVAATESTTRDSLMEQLLFSWAGTDSVVPTSRGLFIDARKLGVVEAFMGKSFTGLNGANPNDQAALVLNGIYQRIFETDYAALMRQTHLKELYNQVSWGWNDTTHQLAADLTQVAATITDLMATDSSAGKDVLAAFARTWRTDNSTDTLAYLNFREQFISVDSKLGWVIDSGGLAPQTSNTGTNGAEAIDLRATSLNYVSSGNGADVIYAGNRNSYLYNNDGDAILVGGAGNDYLSGGAGDDILDGGSGNDELQGSSGNDIYIFRRGAGKDYIYEYGAGDAGDVIYVGDFITTGELTARRSNNDLVLTITDSGDQMQVANWFSNEGSRIEQIKFADGTTWGVDDLKRKVLEATPYDDYITGNETNDVIVGLAGNDSLYGNDGDDILDGGSGNDTLTGDSGSDTYVWGCGSGSDSVVEQAATAGETNCIQLTEGVTAENLQLMVSGADLYLAIKDTDDQLQIKGWFASKPAGLD
jgi:Ca2+-binding RTX toxin-like protein